MIVLALMFRTRFGAQRMSTYVVENNKRLGPATTVVADGMENASADDGGQQLLNEEGQEGGRDSSQVEVVNQEQGLQLEGRAIAHKLATTEDDSVVDGNEYSRLLQGGHGSLSSSEPEFACWIASNGSPDLVKDRP